MSHVELSVGRHAKSPSYLLSMRTARALTALSMTVLRVFASREGRRGRQAPIGIGMRSEHKRDRSLVRFPFSKQPLPAPFPASFPVGTSAEQSYLASSPLPITSVVLVTTQTRLSSYKLSGRKFRRAESTCLIYQLSTNNPDMPNTPKPPPTMDNYVRKAKPRTVPTSHPPAHTVTAAPRALVRPATAVRLSAVTPPDEISARASRTREHLASRSPATVSTPKPRKRFRKKVNGLFGDQTDLKKRMSKLLRETDTNALLRYHESEGLAEQTQPADSQPLPAVLPPADAVVRKLNEVAMRVKVEKAVDGVKEATEKASEDVANEADPDPEASLDSFDSPAFVATASRVLGSPERLRAVRKSMGRLSPRSNERFIEELQLGPSSTVAKQENTEDTIMEEVSEKIEPPELPSVDSSELETEDREALIAMSPVSVERTAAPAVLRRKVRRLDRGYRSADVLRARLQGTSLAEIAASPTSHRRSDKGSRWPRTRVRKLDLDGDGMRSRGSKRQLSERLQLEESQVETESDGLSSSDGAPLKKRRFRTDSQRDVQNDTDDTYNASDPLAMLVDAAAAEEQKQRSMRKRARQLRTGERSSGNGQTPSKERRRKKKSGSRQKVVETP